MSKTINLTLKVWRQDGPHDKGRFETYHLRDVSTRMSFLEMMDLLNQQLIAEGKRPVEFEHDCREGICGACSMVINGHPHGKQHRTTTCQLHMRHFKDGETIYVEPFRAEAFPVIKDLVVDRSAFDRIMAAGGYISANVGSPQDANAIPVPKPDADKAFDAAECIGCGACVAACPNASAMLFVAAKVSHLAYLPQGHPERERRVQRMIAAMDEEGFGHCTNVGACSLECPKAIPQEFINRLNREFLRASFVSERPTD